MSSAYNKTRFFNSNRIVYFLFLVAGLFFFIKQDYTNAIIFIGSGPLFDPFNPKQPYKQRPAYQRMVLMLHVALTIACFVLLFLKHK